MRLVTAADLPTREVQIVRTGELLAAPVPINLACASRSTVAPECDTDRTVRGSRREVFLLQLEQQSS